MLYYHISPAPKPGANLTDDGEMVKKIVLLPKTEVERFKARHRGHGDFTWFVREVLKKYNDLNDVDPDELLRLAAEGVTLRSS